MADEARAAVNGYYAQKGGNMEVMVAIMATKCLKPKVGLDVLPKCTDKTYILSVVQSPRINSEGLKAALQVFKKPSAVHGWELKQSMRLNCLTFVHLLNTPNEGRNFLEIGVQQPGYMRTETRLLVMIESLSDLRIFIVQLHRALVSIERHSPKFVNLDSLIYSSAASTSAPAACVVPATAAAGQVLQQADMDENDPLKVREDDVTKELEGSMAIALTPEEEADLQQLLHQLMSGKGADLVDFANNMQMELDALEQANVHALMSSVELGYRIGQQLQDAIASLDDLDQSLQVFDAKLRHMRDDIASIEARNNRLEVAARNDSKLLQAVEELLQKLDLPRSQEEVLQSQALTMERLPQCIAAAWDLAERLQQLGDTSIGTVASHRRVSLKPAQAKWLPHMDVVHHTRDKLNRVRQDFDIRAQDFVSRQLNLIAQHTAQAVNLQISKSGLQMPDHSAMRSQLNRLMPLMEVMTALTADSLRGIRSKYSTSMHELLDKELQAYVPALQKVVAGSSGSKQTDVDASEFEEGMLQRGAGFAGGTGGARVDWNMQFGQGQGEQTSAHRAYKMYLDSFVPFLLQEASFAADFLQLWQQKESKAAALAATGRTRANVLARVDEVEGTVDKQTERRLTSEGIQLIHAMLEGQKVQGGASEGATRRFLQMTNVASMANQPLSIIPMLDSTLSWTDKLRDSSDSEQSASAGVLVNAMLECKLALVKGFNDHLRVWCDNLEKYNASYRMSGAKTVKSLHVLPFVTNLLETVGSMEELLQESQMINKSQPRAGAGKNVTNVNVGGRGKKVDQDFEDDDSFDELDTLDGNMAVPEVVGVDRLPAAAQIHDARQLVDAAFSIMFQHVFEHLEKLASLDPKHGTRLRMENYLAVVQELKRFSGSTPTLEAFMNTAHSKHQGATATYVKQQLEYVGFWPIVKLTQDLQRMRDEQTEVALMVPAGQVRETVGTCMKEADKKLTRINERIRKHLEGSSPKLMAMAWARLCGDLLKWYRQLDNIIQACYPRNTIKLVPSPDQLASLCHTAAS